MCGRLTTFRECVGKFVLPRILLGEDTNRIESILSGFSQFFTYQWESSGVKQLDNINQNVQSLDPASKQIKTFWSAMYGTLHNKPFILVLSTILGFSATTLIIFGILNVDATEWIKSNVGSFILAGTALSALIAGIFARN